MIILQQEKKVVKRPLKGPLGSMLQGAFHLLLLVCVFVVCVYFFITLEWKDFRTVELGPHTLIYLEGNSRLQSLQNEIANIFTLQGRRNIILPLHSNLKKFFFLLISNCVIFVWLSAQSVCVLSNCQVSEERVIGCCFIAAAQAERKLGRDCFCLSPKSGASRYQ